MAASYEEMNSCIGKRFFMTKDFLTLACYGKFFSFLEDVTGWSGLAARYGAFLLTQVFWDTLDSFRGRAEASVMLSPIIERSFPSLFYSQNGRMFGMGERTPCGNFSFASRKNTLLTAGKILCVIFFVKISQMDWHVFFHMIRYFHFEGENNLLLQGAIVRDQVF